MFIPTFGTSWRVVAVSYCALATACSDASVLDPSQPSGTPCADCAGCDGWRHASCEYATRCGKATKHCQAQYAAIACRSEAAAEACAYVIHDAYCDQVKPECGALQVADSTRAVQGCQRYREAACASAVRCHYASNMEACLAKPAIDCSKAVALSATFDQCLAELPNVGCPFWLPPDSCLGVVITSQE